MKVFKNWHTYLQSRAQNVMNAKKSRPENVIRVVKSRPENVMTLCYYIDN